MNSVRMVAVGDVVFNNRYKSPEDLQNSDKIFKAFKEQVSGANIVFANLEGPISLLGRPNPQKVSLRSAPGWLKVLASAGFNLFSLANNHILDYGIDAAQDTVNGLHTHNINCVGYGLDESHARKPLVLRHNDMSFAFLAYCTVENKDPIYANGNCPGIPFGGVSEICEDITKIKKEVDYVIISLHWGIEHYLYPSTEQVAIAHAAIDAGASVILGHHPHVVQGAELYKDGLIFYSLGNFVFDDLYWEGCTIRGEEYIDRIQLTQLNRESLAVDLVFKTNGAITYKYKRYKCDAVSLVISEVSENHCQVSIDYISSRLSSRLYSLWWWFYSFKKEYNVLIKQAVSIFVKLVTKPHKLRWHHFMIPVELVAKAINSILGKRIG